MLIDNYQYLQKSAESLMQYHNRLLYFAIERRIDRSSNFRYVADQIVRLGLASQFNAYTVSNPFLRKNDA
jgi:hypothetical protein